MIRTFEREFGMTRLWVVVDAPNGVHMFEFIRVSSDEGRPPFIWQVFYQDEIDGAGADLGLAQQWGPHDLVRAATIIAREADKEEA